MILIISIEGGKSYTERNVFKYINEQAIWQFNNPFLVYETIALDKLSESEHSRKSIIGLLKSHNIEYDLVTKAYVLSDWDVPTQYDALNFTFSVVSEWLSSKGVQDIHWIKPSNEQITLNNSEGDIFLKLNVPQYTHLEFCNQVWSSDDIHSMKKLKKSVYKDAINNAMMSIHSLSFEESFNDTLNKIIEVMAHNNSSYLPIFLSIKEVLDI